ncbi:VOC family protein [Deinococcus fonticola]|uniref:VOC family protein n=1 Tax=Deinococcus fonticola TaxID=2528713 RepID=UPI0010751012|nr:VOC family protein [Deinococcus fonticola]
MNWTLEVVVVPVSDIDQAKVFYEQGLGFHLDFDHRWGETFRVVQLTPLGSGCSIQLGQGLTSMPAGSLRGLQLVVRDLRAAHAELTGGQVPVSDIQVFDRSGAQRPAQADDDLNNVGFMHLKDPDGNSWSVQQITDRP